MDNIESYRWLFFLDHPDIKITQVSNFIEWIFVTDNYIFPNVFNRHRSWKLYHRYFVKSYAYLDSDPTAMPRVLGDVTAVGVPAATHCACFEQRSKLDGDLSDLGGLTSICSATTGSHDDPTAICGDLAAFAYRSEIAVLCGLGIKHKTKTWLSAWKVRYQHYILWEEQFNTFRPRQTGRHIPDDILKCIFLNENI